MIGDNIANANTIGFKQGRVNFADSLAQNLAIGSGQVGLGSRVQTVQKMFTQGALATTGSALDLALSGSGFFEVRGTTTDGRQGTFLTRAGQFAMDKDGFLVNADGLRVQGYAANSAGVVLSAIGDLMVGNANAAPSPTAHLTMKANLNSDSAPIPAAFDPLNPTSTSSFASSVSIVDPLGKTIEAPIYFRKGATGTWDWHVVTDGANVNGGTAGVNSEIADGALTFTSDGRLQTSTAGTAVFTPAGTAVVQPLAFDFGDPIGAGGTGVAGITQFATTSSTTFASQDGFGAGQLSAVQIDKTGTVLGVFTNGQTRNIGQVGVATVAAPDQLERVGGNLYSTTTSSGTAVAGNPGSGGRGFITAGALEQSNVDIAEQFIRMIAAQRSFEANSKVITTADQLLSELIQMKR